MRTNTGLNQNLMRRISLAIVGLDLGLPAAFLQQDPLRGINMALRILGGPAIGDLSNGSLGRALRFLEGAGQ